MAIVALLLLGILAWPVWEWLWREWLGNQYYSHGMLIPIVSLFLAFRRFQLDKALSQLTLNGNAAGLILLAVSLLGFVISLNNRTFFMASFAMIGIVAGLIWVLGGSQILYKMRFPVSYLCLLYTSDAADD